MEGVDRVWSTAHKAPIWGYSILSTALVFPFAGEPLYPLALCPHLPERMASSPKEAKTPQEMATDTVLNLLEMGYRPLAVVGDGQVVRSTFARTLRLQGQAFVGRLGKKTRVVWGGRTWRAGDLLQTYPPGKARYYRALGVYAKRLSGVFWPTVGKVDLVLVWRARGEAWEGWVLVSTFGDGVQGVLRVWSARWELEVAHRVYKQGLGLGECRVRSFEGQMGHWELVVEAYHRVRKVVVANPGMPFRMAKAVALQGSLADRGLADAIPTGFPGPSPPRKRLQKGGGNRG